jgi:hypothetical protein
VLDKEEHRGGRTEATMRHLLTAILSLGIISGAAVGEEKKKTLADFSQDELASIAAAYLVFKSNCSVEFTLQGTMKYGEALQKIDKENKELLTAKYEELDQGRKEMGGNKVFCAAVRSMFGRDLKE